MRKSVFVIVVLAIAALTGGGVAWASIPGSDGVIHACYQSPPPAHGANLQVIDTDRGGSCSGGMVPLAWRQVNPTVVTSDVNLSFAAGGINGTAVACPAGQLATGGGAGFAFAAPLVLIATWPLQGNTAAPNGWQAAWRNTSGTDLTTEVVIYAVCTGGAS